MPPQEGKWVLNKQTPYQKIWRSYNDQWVFTRSECGLETSLGQTPMDEIRQLYPQLEFDVKKCKTEIVVPRSLE